LQEYDPRVNAKELAVNTLIGLLLLLAFVIPVTALLGAIGLAFYGLSLAAKSFLPGVPEYFWFSALLCLFSIASGVGYLRKRFWSNALLSFSITGIALLAWFGGARRVDSSWGFLYPVFLLMLFPSDRSLRRWETALAGALVVAGILLNARFLAGTAARVVSDCSFPVIFIWMAVQFRRGRFAGRNLSDLSQAKT